MPESQYTAPRNARDGTAQTIAQVGEMAHGSRLMATGDGLWLMAHGSWLMTARTPKRGGRARPETMSPDVGPDRSRQPKGLTPTCAAATPRTAEGHSAPSSGAERT